MSTSPPYEFMSGNSSESPQAASLPPVATTDTNISTTKKFGLPPDVATPPKTTSAQQDPVSSADPDAPQTSSTEPTESQQAFPNLESYWDKIIIDNRKRKRVVTEIAEQINAGKPEDEKVTPTTIADRWRYLVDEDKVPNEIVKLWRFDEEDGWTLEEDESILLLWMDGKDEPEIAYLLDISTWRIKDREGKLTKRDFCSRMMGKGVAQKSWVKETGLKRDFSK